MMSSVFQVEIDFPGHPVLVALGQERRDEAEASAVLGKIDAAHLKHQQRLQRLIVGNRRQQIEWSVRPKRLEVPL